MAEYIGSEAAIALQRRLGARRDMIGESPWLASGGRILVYVDPDAITWPGVRALAEEDGYLALTVLDRERMEFEVLRGLGATWHLDFWDVFLGEPAEVLKAAGSVVKATPLPDGWQLSSTLDPDADEIDDVQQLNLATGVSPNPAVSGAGAALTVGSPGEWWWGDRGVLHAPRLPGRTAAAFGWSGAWALALLSGDRRLLGLLPLLLAPPDVPTWVPWGAASARSLPALSWGRGLALGALLLGLWGLAERRSRVGSEDRVLRAVVAQLEPGDVLEAPWSWGARASVLATGDPYGARWIAVPRGVRDQQRCPAQRLVALPPGAEPSTGASRVDAHGVVWGPGC